MNNVTNTALVRAALSDEVFTRWGLETPPASWTAAQRFAALYKVASRSGNREALCSLRAMAWADGSPLGLRPFGWRDNIPANALPLPTPNDVWVLSGQYMVWDRVSRTECSCRCCGRSMQVSVLAGDRRTGADPDSAAMLSTGLCPDCWEARFASPAV